MPDLGPAVDTIVNRCLGVRPGEDVLVIADNETRSIGEALRKRATSAGADVVLTIMDSRDVDGADPPRPVAGALAACDVFMAPTIKSLSHTTARKKASDAGAHGAALLTQYDFAHLSCPRGSDFRLDLAGRRVIADEGALSDRGAFGNLPCGEGFILPCDGEGTIVVSGTLASVGPADEPVTLTVHRGRLNRAEGGVGPRFLELLHQAGEEGTNLAELGIGTNERAQLTGKILKDEKILGTVHVALARAPAFAGRCRSRSTSTW